MLGYILLFSIGSAVVAMLGGLVLLANHRLARLVSVYLLSFAAGALLGAAFLGLLPEAAHELSKELNHQSVGWLLSFTLLGILIFFVMEKLLIWWHFHAEDLSEHHHAHPKRLKPSYAMILLGDAVHNAIDGVVIALAFFVSVPVGVATSVAVILHEAPQEIGDFGVLIHAGLRKARIFFYNLGAALATPVAAIVTFFAQDALMPFLAPLLALAAGNFIYIASSDLIPEIHKHHHPRRSILQVVMMLAGVGIMYILG